MLEEDSVVSYINEKLCVARVLFSEFSSSNTFNFYWNFHFGSEGSVGTKHNMGKGTWFSVLWKL